MIAVNAIPAITIRVRISRLRFLYTITEKKVRACQRSWGWCRWWGRSFPLEIRAYNDCFSLFETRRRSEEYYHNACTTNQVKRENSRIEDNQLFLQFDYEHLKTIRLNCLLCCCHRRNRCIFRFLYTITEKRVKACRRSWGWCRGWGRLFPCWGGMDDDAFLLLNQMA